MKVRLSLAIQPYDRVLPLIGRELEPSGVTLDYQGMPGGNGGVFYDQIRFGRYDVSEMSISTFLIERARGWPFVMLPIFHNRNFSYTDIVIRDGSGIRVDHPEDLAGKRFAIRDYQQTAGLWIRGVLAHEFHVEPHQMRWLQTRDRARSLTGASGVAPPVPVEYTNTETGMLFDLGEVDAAWSGAVATANELGAVARSDVDVRGRTGTMLLFSDPKAEAIRYFRRSGIFPAHHVTVIRESIVHEHPWIATSLLEAFEAAKRIAQRRTRLQSLLVFSEHLSAEVADLMGSDPHPYGVAPNNVLISTLQTMSVEQQLTTAAQAREELFAPESLAS